MKDDKKDNTGLIYASCNIFIDHFFNREDTYELILCYWQQEQFYSQNVINTFSGKYPTCIKWVYQKNRRTQNKKEPVPPISPS